MTLILAVVGALGVVVLAERSAEYLLFAFSALFLNAALLLIFVADLERAILLSGVLAVAIRPPTVPPGTSRLRLALRATHSSADISAIADAVIARMPR